MKEKIEKLGQMNKQLEEERVLIDTKQFRNNNLVQSKKIACNNVKRKINVFNDQLFDSALDIINRYLSVDSEKKGIQKQVILNMIQDKSNLINLNEDLEAHTIIPKMHIISSIMDSNLNC